MAADPGTNKPEDDVDEALAAWRQGDCTLGDHWFVHMLDVGLPLTEPGRDAAAAGGHLAEGPVRGLVVLSQTCDIVRSCGERPFVEVAPLVEVDEERLHEIERARRPAYAFMPRLADRRLVADLDRVMSVEKPVVAKWTRIRGWTTDAEARAFAQALSRKRIRFPFPDDFSDLAKRLLCRLVEKHDRNSLEGRALRALREIRVQAEPSWDGEVVTLMFWFVREEADASFEGVGWDKLLAKWLKLVPRGGRFPEVQGEVVTLDNLTAADYVHSDPLDLDHLSSQEEQRSDQEQPPT